MMYNATISTSTGSSHTVHSLPCLVNICCLCRQHWYSSDEMAGVYPAAPVSFSVTSFTFFRCPRLLFLLQWISKILGAAEGDGETFFSTYPSYWNLSSRSRLNYWSLLLFHHADFRPYWLKTMFSKTSYFSKNLHLLCTQVWANCTWATF